MDIVSVLERVSKSIPTIKVDSQFRSPDLLLRSVSKDTVGFSAPDDGAVVRALFADDRGVQESPTLSPDRFLIPYLHKVAREGQPSLLRFTYALIRVLLSEGGGDLEEPPVGPRCTRRLMLDALADLAPVAAGLSARMAASFEHVTGGAWEEACRARQSDARVGADAEDADIRVLLSSSADIAGGARRSLAFPDDISQPYSVERDSKLLAHTPADHAAFQARESLRKKALALVDAYRGIGTSFVATTWPELLQRLPAEIAEMRALLLPCNAPWFSRLLLFELELFHAHELLGGAALTDPRLLRCESGDGRLQQLSERLSGESPVGISGDPVRDLILASCAPFVAQAAAPSTEPSKGDLLERRMQGAWRSKVSLAQSLAPKEAVASPAPAPPGVRSLDGSTRAGSTHQKEKDSVHAWTPSQAPGLRPHDSAAGVRHSAPKRAQLHDGSNRAGRGIAPAGSAGGQSVARSEGPTLESCMAVVEALRLRGACRFFVLIVLLLDSHHVAAAFRTRVAAELRRCSQSDGVQSTLKHRCESSLLPLSHRSRAHAQVLAALDLAPLIVATKSAFKSDAMEAWADFKATPLSVDCAACLQHAASDGCLVTVVPWVCQYVLTTSRCVPVDQHGALQETYALLLSLAADAQQELLPSSTDPATMSLASDTPLAKSRFSPCVALVMIAAVEDLVGQLDINVAHVATERPCLRRNVASASVQLDTSNTFIGHRFLVEACPSLRPLHELLRRRALAAQQRVRLGDTTAQSQTTVMLSTPNKSRAESSVIAQCKVEHDSSGITDCRDNPLTVLVEQDTSSQIGASLECRLPPLSPPHLASTRYTKDPPVAASPEKLLRQTSAPARKIQLTLLAPLHGSAPLPSFGSPVIEDHSRAHDKSGLADPSFQNKLAHKFYEKFKHLRRVVQALAECSAEMSVFQARRLHKHDSQLLVTNAAEGLAQQNALSDVVGWAASRAAAAVRIMFSHDFVSSKDLTDDLRSSTARASDAVQEETERSIVTNLCVQEAELRTRALMRPQSIGTSSST